jgi:pilus assembly protein CpaE
MRPAHSTRLASERGQASVELVGVLPFVILGFALAWQLALTGHTAWLCANAARVAARAEAVDRDPEKAARSALPRSLERGLEVDRRRGGGVRVSVRVPVLARSWRSPLSLAASTSFGGKR